MFFFKQKTAYEMRISDWSSDVCSSDLHAKAMGFLRINPPGGKQHFFRLASAELPCVSMIFDAANPHSNDRIAEPGVIRRYDQVAGPREHQAEIGRATSRRRVCQYV